MSQNISAYKIKKFYAASNSHNGFYSLFDSIFSSEKLKRIYIIKGGPGCGKSTAMKAISDHAAKNDFEVVEYFCSSSPSSLDGVIIPQLSTAVLDGTSPHTVDPKFPAVCENIVDFGVSWNIDKAKITLSPKSVLILSSLVNFVPSGINKGYIVSSKILVSLTSSISNVLITSSISK